MEQLLHNTVGVLQLRLSESKSATSCSLKQSVFPTAIRTCDSVDTSLQQQHMLHSRHDIAPPVASHNSRRCTTPLVSRTARC